MIKTIQPDWKAPRRIRACCTTRAGGVSLGPFESFNLAQHVGDRSELVEQNRLSLRQQLGLPSEPEWINQTHGTHTVTLEQESTRDADAAITREPGRVAVVMTADCLPILLCNRQGSEVAAIHAGWRGLQAGVIQSALASMKSANQELIAWIGPGISQPSFEVGEEVREAFSGSMLDTNAFFDENRKGHWLCDLPGLAELILNTHSVVEVYRDLHCSYRDVELFYSYRREATTGRMASMIWIN